MTNPALSIESLLEMTSASVQTRRKHIIQQESDPSGKDPSKTPGTKTDSGKIMMGLLEDFQLALTAVADVATYGATGKYTRGGWKKVGDAEHRYQDARIGHYLKSKYENQCPHTGLHHKAQAAWCALAELEAYIAANPELTAQYLERIATKKPQAEGV